LNTEKGGTSVKEKMLMRGIIAKETVIVRGPVEFGTVGAAGITGRLGAVGAAVSGGAEVVRSGVKLAKGEIGCSQFVGNVAKEGVGGGLASVGGTVAGGLAVAAIGVTAPLWVGLTGLGTAVVVGAGIKNAWNSLWD
jgi:hypothetical protein